MGMTPEELEAHVNKELVLKEEIEVLKQRLRNTEYRTKTEKSSISEQLQEKRHELREHLGLA
jgi:hypothetical protein